MSTQSTLSPAGTPPAGHPLPAAGSAQPEEELRKESLPEALASIALVFVVYCFIAGFVAQNFYIPSGSMEKTLLVGDHVLVDRITFSPPATWAPFVHYRDIRRGDIIVFLKPNPESPDMVLVKRAIGVPGDRIHLNHGVVYLNGVAQNEPYAHAIANDADPDNAYNPPRDDFPSQGAPYGSTALWSEDLPSHIQNGDLVVPAGMVFAMGDNRTHSLDGRFWGFVPRQNILGRPLFNYWSFESKPEDSLEQPPLTERLGSMVQTALHFFTKTRWNRTGKLIQ